LRSKEEDTASRMPGDDGYYGGYTISGEQTKTTTFITVLLSLATDTVFAFYGVWVGVDLRLLIER
jgi:hypothetical protein